MTLYIHDGCKHFVPFGRFSYNPKYKAYGRMQYPEDQGCIAQGWEKGWHFENSLGEGADYDEVCSEKYKIPKHTLEKMHMKSQLYAVKRIDKDGEPLAVLVVESTDRNRFDEKNIKEELDGKESFIAHFIVQFKDYIRTRNEAKKRGFS